MTRPKPLGHPIRCSRCGTKFTRQHGNERLCERCRPYRLKARSAARAAVKPIRLEANRQARQYDDLIVQATARWAEVLASYCPHRDKLGDCPEPWCANRVADMELQGGYLPGLFTANGTPIRIAAITPFGVVLDDRYGALSARSCSLDP